MLAEPGFALDGSILVGMPQYDETLDVHSVSSDDDGGITYDRIPNPPAQPQQQPLTQPQQHPVPLVAASPEPGPTAVPVSPGTVTDWGVIGTAVAGLAWFFSQLGPFAEDVPVG
jgi:hypothetical protein